MSIRALDAANAYANSVGRLGTTAGPEPVEGAQASGGFADFLSQTFSDAVQTTAKSEAAGAQQVTKTGDLVDVVTAVNSAEIALETMVAVRDRMVSAYQEIMRMPI